MVPAVKNVIRATTAAGLLMTAHCTPMPNNQPTVVMQAPGTGQYAVQPAQPMMQGQPMMPGQTIMQGPPMAPGQPMMQGQPMAPGQPMMQGQPMAPGQPMLQGQPMAPGQPMMQGQPMAQGEPMMPGQPMMQGQPMAQGQPIMPGQPMAPGQPIIQGQPPAQSGPPGALPPSIVRAFPVQGDPAQPHPGQPPTMQGLASVGYAIRPNIASSGGCAIDMVLNRDQFLRSLPQLIQSGVLSHLLTVQQAQVQILSVSIAFGLQAAAITAHEVLTEPKAPPACHFRQALGVPGADGQLQIIPMFEFDMNRNIDQSAPWLQLLTAGFTAQSAEGFVDAAPNFRLAPGVTERVQQENQS